MFRICMLGAAALFLLACSTTQWRMEDSHGQVSTLSAPYFAPSERLEFRVGSATRQVEASQIQWLSIDPSDMKVEDAKILYGARLVLRDGTRIPDSTAADTLVGAFVGLDAKLMGSAGTGRIEIPLSQLRHLETINPDKAKPADAKPAPAPAVKADTIKPTPAKPDTTKAPAPPASPAK